MQQSSARFFLFALGLLVSSLAMAAEPVQVKVLKEQEYGYHKLQTMDMYLPSYPLEAKDQLAILMIHDGTDKTDSRTIKYKIDRWLTNDILFASTNYRVSPYAKPISQVADIAGALALFQRKISAWGGDPTKVVIIGHGVGGYLASLLTSTPYFVEEENVQPWLGTVVINSTALDVVSVMENEPSLRYEDMFGRDLEYWRSVSPLDQLKHSQFPQLIVCSRMPDEQTCDFAEAMEFVGHRLGVEIDTLRVRLTHSELNEGLGIESDYTNAVEQFMGNLYLNN